MVPSYISIFLLHKLLCFTWMGNGIQSIAYWGYPLMWEQNYIYQCEYEMPFFLLEAFFFCNYVLPILFFCSLLDNGTLWTVNAIILHCWCLVISPWPRRKPGPSPCLWILAQFHLQTNKFEHGFRSTKWFISSNHVYRWLFATKLQVMRRSSWDHGWAVACSTPFRWSLRGAPI